MLSFTRNIIFLSTWTMGIVCMFPTTCMGQSSNSEELKFNELSPKSVIFGLDSNKIQIEYVVISSPQMMRLLADTLAPENFPMITLPQGIFDQGINVVKDLESLSYLYENVRKELQVLQQLGQQRDSVYESIIHFENERVDLLRGTNQELNNHIDQLNEQLNSSMQLTEESIKGRNRKNFTIGILGGLAGISAGIILGLLVSN